MKWLDVKVVFIVWNKSSCICVCPLPNSNRQCSLALRVDINMSYEILQKYVMNTKWKAMAVIYWYWQICFVKKRQTQLSCTCNDPLQRVVHPATIYTQLYLAHMWPTNMLIPLDTTCVPRKCEKIVKDVIWFSCVYRKTGIYMQTQKPVYWGIGLGPVT